jgi:hypothetical protein
MLPEAKNEDLLYASDVGDLSNIGQVIVFSYPDGKVVGILGGFDQPDGECVDTSGDVWIADAGGLYEYAHGGTQPIATLKDHVQGCSVDPSTGNLAGAVPVLEGGVYVWTHAQGTPTWFPAYNNEILGYCGYDGQGNLFASARSEVTRHLALVELPKGGNGLITLLLRGNHPAEPGQVQWDGRYIAVQSRWLGGEMFRFQVTGDRANVVGSSTFNGVRALLGESGIQNGKAIIAFGTRHRKFFWNKIGLWDYPQGGNVTKVIQDGKGAAKHAYSALAVSLAPH